jgi:hypothetical protein
MLPVAFRCPCTVHRVYTYIYIYIYIYVNALEAFQFDYICRLSLRCRKFEIQKWLFVKTLIINLIIRHSRRGRSDIHCCRMYVQKAAVWQWHVYLTLAKKQAAKWLLTWLARQPDDGSSMLLRNVCKPTYLHCITSQKTERFGFTAVADTRDVSAMYFSTFILSILSGVSSYKYRWIFCWIS